jgi:hypothetical protein
MEKQLKDYLHLYLGCEGEFTKKKTYGSAKRSIETLDTSLLDRVASLPSLLSFKPILSPLSSMTEEEALVIGKLITDEMVDKVSRLDVSIEGRRIEIFYDNDSEKIDLKANQVSWIERGKDTWHHLPVHNYAEFFTYLLSKHFDLFGLIEAGLAIEKK